MRLFIDTHALFKRLSEVLWMNEVIKNRNVGQKLIITVLLTLWPVPAMYNCRSGSCSSNKLVTLLCNGIEPNRRTAKLQVASSLATSVNMRSICFCTLLLTHSTPYSMILAAVVVVVVVVVVRVTLIGFPRWYTRPEERFEFVPRPELSRLLAPRLILLDELRTLLLRTLLLRLLLLRPQRMPLLLLASRILPASCGRDRRRCCPITGFKSSSRWLNTDLIRRRRKKLHQPNGGQKSEICFLFHFNQFSCATTIYLVSSNIASIFNL